MEPFTFHKEYLIREFARHDCVGNPNILRLAAFQMGLSSSGEEYCGQLWMDNQSLARHSLEPSLDLAGRILDFEFTAREFSNTGPDRLLIYEVLRAEYTTRISSLPPITINKSIVYEAKLKSPGVVQMKGDLPRYELIVPLTSDEYQKLTELPADVGIVFSMKLKEREREGQHTDV